MNNITETKISINEFDRTLLPVKEQRLEGKELRKAIKRFYESESDSNIDVLVTSDEIILRWGADQNNESLNDQAIELLQNGELEKGISILEMVVSSEPSNAEALYNLGMALSDNSQFKEAKAHLEKCSTLGAGNARVWLALGVCYFRMENNSEALRAFDTAYKTDSTDPYVLKTLGAFLTDTNCDLDKAKKLLDQALLKLPNDQQLWYNVGQLSVKLDDLDSADEAYVKGIDLNPHSNIGEACKVARSKISEKVFKEKSDSSIGRPDGLMYCLGALQMFDMMTEDEVKKITLEIAILGMRGLDVNDPAQKYSITSLKGNYSGLNLLCIEYVGFKQLDPTVDLGFDLTKEYEAATAMHKK